MGCDNLSIIHLREGDTANDLNIEIYDSLVQVPISLNDYIVSIKNSGGSEVARYTIGNGLSIDNDTLKISFENPLSIKYGNYTLWLKEITPSNEITTIKILQLNVSKKEVSNV